MHTVSTAILVHLEACGTDLAEQTLGNLRYPPPLERLGVWPLSSQIALFVVLRPDLVRDHRLLPVVGERRG